MSEKKMVNFQPESVAPFTGIYSYPMNGTKAPYKTTLYGLFDRSLSFDQKRRFFITAMLLGQEKETEFINTCKFRFHL